MINQYLFDILLSSPAIPFQYGNLSELYPSETYSEITARRQSNWDLLKDRANVSKLTGDILSISNKTIEFFRPLNDAIDISSGEWVRIFGAGDQSKMIFYPFTMRTEITSNSAFKLSYGAKIQLQNLTYKCAQKQGKFETYNCVLRKGGNARLIELTGSIRPSFWASLAAGETVYYSWIITTLAETKLIASWDEVAKTITLTTDITNTISSDTVALFGKHFDEDISESDYNTYGDFWLWNDKNNFKGASAIHHSPATSSGIDAEFDLSNIVIENFENGVNISSGNFQVTYNNLSFIDCTNGLSAFARSQLNGQSIIGTNLTMIRNAIWCVGQIDHLGDDGVKGIFGGGGYIHPTVIFTENGTLTLTDNYGYAFKQFSSSIEDLVPGEQTYIKSMIASGGGEYDFYTTNGMPVIIDNISCDDLRVGGSVTINAGEIRQRVIGSISLEPPNGTPVIWEFNNIDFYGEIRTAFNALTEAVHDMEFNDCDFYAQDYTVLDTIIQAHVDTKSVTVNNCRLLKDPNVDIAIYTPGAAVPSGIDCSYLFYDAGKEITINNLLTDFMRGGFFLQSPFSNIIPPYNTRKIYINDSQINLSRLINTNSATTDTYRTNMFDGLRSKVQAFAFDGLGVNLPLSFKPKVAVQSDVDILVAAQTYVNLAGTVSGVLEIDLNYNEYFVNTGTINRIALPTWVGASKNSSESVFTGEIIIHAVGGDVIINGWDAVTNEYGNVLNSVTILSGTSKTFVCDNDRVLAKSANSTVTPIIDTGDGATNEYWGRLVDTLVAPINFSVTAGVVSGVADASGSISGAGINSSSYIDFGTGTYYILFDDNVANGVDVIISYEKYNNRRQTGVWLEIV